MLHMKPEPYVTCLLCDERMQGLLTYDTTTQRVFCWQCEQAKNQRDDTPSTKQGD